MSQYSLAIIGCGGRARAHVPGINAEPRLKITAVADVRAESAEAFVAENGYDATVYTDYAELLQRESRRSLY